MIKNLPAITEISGDSEIFRVYALEKQFSCTCGGNLHLRSKAADEDTFVCGDCRTIWAYNFREKNVRKIGKAKTAFIRPYYTYR